MSSLEQRLTEYLAVRRAMGYKLARAGKLLPQFAGWMAERDQHVITTELVLAWATLPAVTGSNWHRQRLSVVRGFATHMHAIDPTHEVAARRSAAVAAAARGPLPLCRRRDRRADEQRDGDPDTA